MLKTLISPVQQWLLKTGQCVGCGMPLTKGEQRKSKKGQLFICKCGRGYFKLSDGKWRRAVASELG